MHSTDGLTHNEVTMVAAGFANAFVETMREGGSTNEEIVAGFGRIADRAIAEDLARGLEELGED